MNQIELIKAEIERMKEAAGIGLSEYDMGQENGKVEVCNALLSIIESLEKEQPQGLDEAANNYGVNIRKGYPRVMDETDKFIYNAFKAGAKWMADRYEKLSGELVTESTK